MVIIRDTMAMCTHVQQVFAYFQEFADSVGIPYLETSAKNANNVERAFSILTSSLLRDVPAKQPATGRGTVTLSAAGSGRRFLESKCCTNCF